MQGIVLTCDNSLLTEVTLPVATSGGRETSKIAINCNSSINDLCKQTADRNANTCNSSWSDQCKQTADRNAINCNSAPDFLQLKDIVNSLVEQSLAKQTRRAYASDVRRFIDWGGTIPASPDMIACYVAAHARSHAPSTVQRWLTALSQAHIEADMPNPTKSSVVRATLKGMKRVRGTRQKKAKPLVGTMVDQVVKGLRAESLSDLRDRALILIGFDCGLRRSEIVALNVEDLDFAVQGLAITIKRSKTDQTAEGRKIVADVDHGGISARNALETWLTASGVDHGPVFRPISRHGSVLPHRLSGEAVSIILRSRMVEAGLAGDGFSGHSLRSGYVTTAALAGVPTWKIRRQTGHASEAVLAGYIREVELGYGVHSSA